MNNFREWLSDNLRYFMLIFGILAVLVALFFGVRAISARISDDRQDDVLSMDSVVESVAGKTLAAVTGADSAAEAVLSAAEEPASEHGELVRDPASPVTALMTSYYEAIGKQDIPAVRELVDVLPESKAADISSDRTQYSDIEVYSKPGPVEGSYVVYTTYSYSGQDDSSKLPGISQSYVTADESGAQKIVFSELDAETKTYLDAVSKDKDVVTLVNKVKDEYSAARNGRETADAGTEVSAGQETGNTGDAAAEEEEAEPSGDEEDGSGDYTEEDEEEYNEPEEESYEDEPEEEEPEEDDSSEWTGSAVSQVNVRSGPGFDYDVISELEEGQQVTVVGEESGWYHVISDGVEGYVGHSWVE